MVSVTKCVAGEQYSELLPATKSSKHNGIRWTPADRAGEGELLIDTVRSRAAYHVAEMETPWDGRAFKLDVIRGGTDPESESYHVFAAHNLADRSCDCKGFAYKGHCKHVAAVEALLENDWI